MKELPEGWAGTTLSNVVALKTGPFGSSLHQSDYVTNGVPLVNPMHIVSGRIKPTAYVTVTSETVERLKEFCLLEGDLVLARRGEMGRCAVVQSNEAGWLCGTGSLIVRPEKRLLNAHFLQSYLSISTSVKYLQAASVGSTMANLNQQHLLSMNLLLPPLSEQTRIVAKLDELFSDLDAGVVELKAAQKKLGQYRQSLLKAAVSGDLTAEWRQRNRPAETGAQLLERILAERRARWEARQLAKFEAQGKAPPKDWRKKYPEPARPDTAELPELPEGWVWASVEQLASIGTGVTPLRSKAIFFEGGEVPWVTSGALNQEMVSVASDFVTPTAVKECRLDLYPAGTLLVAMYGEGKTRGKCSELAIPATINQAIAAIVLEGYALECKAHLKSFLLKSYEDMRKHASGGVQPNLNLQIIKTVAVPLPPVKEQQSIQSLLSVHLEAAREQLAATETALHQSSAQRQNILRAAFAGQLVPQDPNDEPASMLLERIRDQRGAQAGAKKPRGRKAKETSHA